VNQWAGVQDPSAGSQAAAPSQPELSSRLLDCKVCGDELRPHLPAVRDSQTGDVFSILKCRRCGLGHTVPLPSDMSKYYRDYHGGRRAFADWYCTGRRIRLLHKLVGVSRGRRLLDIGCGEGTFLLAAKAEGWSVMGTETNPAAARRAGLEVHEELADARALAPFDCITFWHSLEHIPDPRAILREARGMLSPSGVLIVAVPDAGGLQASLFKENWLHLEVPRHACHYTIDSLLSLMRSEKFIPIREWHQEFEYDLLGWSQSALNWVQNPPNLFFNLLRGRKPAAGRLRLGATWLAGCLLTALAVFLVPLGTLARRGGTLIIAGRPG